MVVITTGSQGRSLRPLPGCRCPRHRRVSIKAWELTVVSSRPARYRGSERMIETDHKSPLQTGSRSYIRGLSPEFTFQDMPAKELKLMLNLVKPSTSYRYTRYRHLIKRTQRLASEVRNPSEEHRNSGPLEGDDTVLTATRTSGYVEGVRAGRVFCGRRERWRLIGDIVLKDRDSWPRDGVVLATIICGLRDWTSTQGSDIFTRGASYARQGESGELIESICKDVDRQDKRSC